MSFNTLNIPSILRSAGVTQVAIAGWQTRGHRGNAFWPRALLLHHDASPPGNSPGALQYLIHGFDSDDDTNYDAHIWVDRFGTWHIIAAGYAQHAGIGSGCGNIPRNNGNTYSIGIETDHTTGEPWPDMQLRSLKVGCAALTRAYGVSPLETIWGHKEYAPGRKDDPDGIDMAEFRLSVQNIVTSPVTGKGGTVAEWTEKELRDICVRAIQEWATTAHDERPNAMTLRELLETQRAFERDVRGELAAIKAALNAQ